MDITFPGIRALVTGAAHGIGREIVFKLAKCGAKVTALDKDEATLKEMKTKEPSINPISVDLKDWQATSKALRANLPFDLVVNNAGVAVIGPLTEITEEQYEEMFAVNIKALINVTKTVVHDMVTRKTRGSIVSISSQAAIVGLMHHSLYCATKGAIDAFTRAAALEYGPQNIRFNCVNPTVVMTEMGRQVWGDPKKGDPMLALIPRGRFAEMDDVVSAVIFLLSDHADMITGSSIPVDGGFLCR